MDVPGCPGPPVNKFINLKLPEENIMDTDVIAANVGQLPSTGTAPDREKLLQYIFEKLDILMQYPAYVDNAINQIGALEVSDSPNGGTGDAARANAIGNSVAAREETNRALIEFLKQIYNDVKPVNPMANLPIPQYDRKAAVYQSIAELIGRIDPGSDGAQDLLNTAMNALND
jgi:hypothetical protein